MRILLFFLAATTLANAQQVVSTANPQAAASTQVNELNVPVTISVADVSLKEALREVGKQSGLKVAYAGAVISSRARVSLNIKAVPASDAIRQILRGTKLTYRQSGDGQILIEPAGRERSTTQGVIVGKVVDAKTGRGISRATVSVGNDTRGVVTGEDGTYRLTGISTDVYTVTVRLVGYAKQTRSVTVGEGATVTVDFKLEPSANVLEQVIVTGTVAATELKAVPNAVTVITAKQIEERGITSIAQLFRGEIPGLFAANVGNYDIDEGEVKMFSRGATKLEPNPNGIGVSSDAIKTYVDGVEMADSKYLSQIDPSSIERIEILTGPQASTVYGSNAINGVMQIFTKRGSQSKPSIRLSLISGLIQNNFSTALASEHDYSAQVDATEGRMSYNLGGTWMQVGRWTPSHRPTTVSGFGGVRTLIGPISADLSARYTGWENVVDGGQDQIGTERRATGVEPVTEGLGGINPPAKYNSVSRSYGVRFDWQPFFWWSHQAGFGNSVEDTQVQISGSGFASPGDTTLLFKQGRASRLSQNYVTTLRLALPSSVQATVTLGGDRWRTQSLSFLAEGDTLFGSLPNPNVTRNPANRNKGGFIQGQLGLHDALFFTYGLRVEWNPSYGENANPNLAPPYGVAHTHDIGPLTVKLRTSYGRSTRPPQETQRLGGVPVTGTRLLHYGPYNRILANPELTPELQQGWEGGFEAYWGSRGSLILTRYNQTVDDLIQSVTADSVRSIIPNARFCNTPPDAENHCYTYQVRNLNIATIRNQGWELQGTANVGPLTTRGTYSWTKSRMLGITPKYRHWLTNVGFQPGYSFSNFPEHTWSFGVNYTLAMTAVSLDVNGIGFHFRADDDLYREIVLPLRLQATQTPRWDLPNGYRSIGKGYATANLNATHRISNTVEVLLHVQNLTNFYHNDLSASYPTMGRVTKAGVRIRL